MCGNYCPRNAMTQNPRKGMKQKVEHGIPRYIEDSKKAVDLHWSKGLCNNYLEGGWKIRGGGGGGGVGENDNKREGGLDVKFNTYRGGSIIFSFLFANCKSSGRVIRGQI